MSKDDATDSQGMDFLQTSGRRWMTTYIPIALFLFVLLFPFYWMGITSFKPNEELLARDGNPFWVSSPTLAHFKKLLFDTEYPSWLMNTMLVSVIATLVSLFAAVLAAYAIERLRFKGSRAVGLGIFLAYLIPPVSMLVAGFFLDDVAARVERESYPGDPPGTPLPAATALAESGRFALTALGVNLLALLFFFIPGVNIAAFFVANTYLLGREYFALAAGRFRPRADVLALYGRRRPTVLLAGALLAGMALVPVVNLLTPLFGTTLMVHVHKRLAARERAAGPPQA